MRHSVEPRDRIYVKGHWFLSFAKSMGTHLSSKYGQKRFDSAKKSTTDAIKTAPKRAIQKTAKATGDLIGSKITNKLKSVLKKSLLKHSDDEIEAGRASPKDVLRKRYSSSEER